MSMKNKVAKAENSNGTEQPEENDIENAPSPIDILLKRDIASPVEQSMNLPRLGINWTVRALTQDEFEEISDRASKRVKIEGTNRYRNSVDTPMSYRLMIYYGSVNPDLHDNRLYEHWSIDSNKPDDLIKAMLLPGEIVALSTFISTVSGFDEIFNQFVETAENL